MKDGGDGMGLFVNWYVNVGGTATRPRCIGCELLCLDIVAVKTFHPISAYRTPHACKPHRFPRYVWQIMQPFSRLPKLHFHGREMSLLLQTLV